MERIKIKKLLKNIGSEVIIKGSKEREITGIASNSKQVAPGNLFIAKKGLTNDGVSFIPEAIASGASAILTDLYNPFYPEITQIIHPNTSIAEALIAQEFYGHPSKHLHLVGITGTNGKTTTAYLIRHLFEKTKRRCGLIGTIEWIVGQHVFPSSKTTPELLQNLKLFRDMLVSGCTDCVMEVSSHALDQGRVHSIEFDIAVFTNLTQDHLDYHRTMENYARAKSLLFASLKTEKKRQPKHAIINADSPYHSQILADYSGDVIHYGTGNNSILKAEAIHLTSEGIQLDVSFGNQKEHLATSLIGRYNVYNLLAAIGVGLACELPLSQIVENLRDFSGVPGRLERVPNGKNLSIFIDYAHTPDALANVLLTLRELKRGRLITVFGCGGDRDKSKREKMGSVVEELSDLAIVTSDNPRNEDPEEIIRNILVGFKQPSHPLIIIDREEAIHRAIHMARAEDIVLIAGKGHENYQIFSQKTIRFDDKTVALQACNS